MGSFVISQLHISPFLTELCVLHSQGIFMAHLLVRLQRDTYFSPFGRKLVHEANHEDSLACEEKKDRPFNIDVDRL